MNPIASVDLILIPIFGYIGGRLLEQLLKTSYKRLTGDLVFSQKTNGDSGSLKIKTKSEIYLDEFIIHLEDRQLNIFDLIKSKLILDEHKRIAFGIEDRVEIECLIQSHGDKQLFVDAFIGDRVAHLSQDLETEYENPIDFLMNTKLSVETSKKSYHRNLFKKDC